jgi:hypothetical protein
LTSGGLRARRLEDAASMRWSKLLANLLGNATSAILDMDPGDVYRDRGLFDVERRQLREALAVMRALGLRPLALPGLTSGRSPWRRGCHRSSYDRSWHVPSVAAGVARAHRSGFTCRQLPARPRSSG